MNETAPRTEDLDALDAVSPAMRKRLQAMIARGDPHFILTGSDPAATGGCCPSNEVGHAGRLVAAGILESWQPCGGDNACPSRFYAFRDEREPGAAPPVYRVNQPLRDRVAARLAAR